MFKETSDQMDYKLHEFNEKDDHVHLLASFSPILAISNLVRKHKGKSTYFLCKECWEQIKDKLWGKYLWSHSYCAVSCSGAPLDIIKQYLQNQRQPATEKNIKKSIALTGRERARLTNIRSVTP